jgi:hypothetical protein
MSSFKCKICAEIKPLGDSVSLVSKMCCTCFTSIQIHSRVKLSITFYKKILKERAELTPVRKNKIKLIESMNNIFAFARGDILQLSFGDITYFIEGFLEDNQIKELKYWKGRYILRAYDITNYNFNRMVKTIKAYQSRINNSNQIRNKFWRFANIIAKESKFVVLKDLLKTKLFDYIDSEQKNKYNWLKDFIFEGVAKIYEPGLLPNIALYFNDNYERIFSTLMTQIFPFDKERISFDFPSVNSRTDFGLKLHYRFNSLEVKYIEDLAEIFKVKWDEPHISRFLFINCIKTITRILDDVFRFYYKKLKIRSPVRSIVNISGSQQKSTRKYDEVTYWIALREW